MTTIAVKITKGVATVAADTQLNCNGVAVGSVSKIAQSKRRIFGAAGDMQEISEWINWMKSGNCSRLPSAENFQGFIVHSNGKMEMVDSKFNSYRVEGDMFAFGTGDQIALGAMMAGATAYEAVEIACRVDNGSGGDIECLSFK